MEEKEKITVPKLMAKTGLVDPRKNILNMAMNDELELLRRQSEVLRKENEQLKNENARIQKALNKKNLDLL